MAEFADVNILGGSSSGYPSSIPSDGRSAQRGQIAALSNLAGMCHLELVSYQGQCGSAQY